MLSLEKLIKKQDKQISHSKTKIIRDEINLFLKEPNKKNLANIIGSIPLHGLHLLGITCSIPFGIAYFTGEFHSEENMMNYLRDGLILSYISGMSVPVLLRSWAEKQVKGEIQENLLNDVSAFYGSEMPPIKEYSPIKNYFMKIVVKMVENSIKNHLKNKRYEKAAIVLSSYNREYRAFTQESYQDIAAIFLKLGRQEQALEVLKGQILNTNNVVSIETIKLLNQEGININNNSFIRNIDLSNQEQATLDLFNEKMSESEFSREFSKLIPNPSSSIDLEIQKIIVMQEMYNQPSHEKWEKIIDLLEGENLSQLPSRENVKVYESKGLVNKLLVIKKGDRRIFKKDMERTERIQRELRTVNEILSKNATPTNKRYSDLFYSRPFITEEAYTLTYHPLGIFDKKDQSIYALIFSNGTPLLKIAETKPKLYQRKIKHLVQAISVIQNALKEEEPDYIFDFNKAYASILGRDNIFELFQKKGIETSLIEQIESGLKESITIVSERLSQAQFGSYIDSYLENWILNEKMGHLIRVDNTRLAHAPVQLDLAQALDFSWFLPYNKQREGIKHYININNIKKQEEFAKMYDFACFYRSLRNILVLEEYIQKTGNDKKYEPHITWSLYKSIFAYSRILEHDLRLPNKVKTLLFEIYKNHQKNQSTI